MAKSVFITGAAAGIGRETALAFAAKGYTVGAYDIDARRPGDTGRPDSQRGRHGPHRPPRRHRPRRNAPAGNRIRASQRQPARRDDQQRRHPGRRPLRGDRRRRTHKEIDVNCKGVINGLYAAFPYLRSTPSSVVVNLASASAIYGQPELAVYSATKFFIRAITEALDLEWERYGIRVIDDVAAVRADRDDRRHAHRHHRHTGHSPDRR